MRKAVADCTVYVSGIAMGGPGATKVFDAWRDHRFELITSKEIVGEVEITLLAEGVSLDRVGELRTLLETYATFVEPTEAITACRDKDDNKILAAAAAGNADYIVSDDKDLRVLSPFRGIEIVTVNRFLRRLGIRKTP